MGVDASGPSHLAPAQRGLLRSSDVGGRRRGPTADEDTKEPDDGVFALAGGLGYLVGCAVRRLHSASSGTDNAGADSSPETTAFVSGPTPIRATVEPIDTVTSVTFFVDGRQVCEFGAAPFECEWDAGRDVVAHQVRVVVTLDGGGRVVRHDQDERPAGTPTKSRSTPSRSQ